MSALRKGDTMNDNTDDRKLSELYKEFSDEDRELAEEGIEDYVKNLLAEDDK